MARLEFTDEEFARVLRHRHGRWKEIFLPATFYALTAVIGGKRFKVISKRSPDQELAFWNLSPSWRQTEQGSTAMHAGNPTED